MRLFFLGLCYLCYFIPFDVNTAPCLPFLFDYTMTSAEGDGANPVSAILPLIWPSPSSAPIGYTLALMLACDLDCSSAKPPNPDMPPAFYLDLWFAGGWTFNLLPLCLSRLCFEVELEFWFLLSVPDSYFEESILIYITIIKCKNKI